MGYIKEPEGVDFVINGRPLTDEEDRLIRDFIEAGKAKRNNQATVIRKSKKQEKAIQLK